MNSDNLGRYVKWRDDDGGWHTGRVVTYPPPYDGLTARGVSWNVPMGQAILVSESCTGKLVWVRSGALEKAPMRSEWEPDYEHERVRDCVDAGATAAI